MKNIYFLGGGNMCAALVSRLKNNGDFTLFVAEQNLERQAFLRQQFDITVANALPALTTDDILLLAVKPQDMQNALSSVQAKGALVLSIAAGLSCQTLSHWLNGTHRIVRIMPNTPAQIGMGMAGLFADNAVSDNDKAFAEQIMNAVGKTVWVENEDDLHSVTAISGSGPAYVFYMMNALFQAACDLGMSKDNARQSVLQTFIGAANLAQQSGEDFGELQRKVTSKGGTTAAALAVFENAQTDKIIQQAVIACQNRSIEMGKEMG
ncbi:MAG: pyrroline-5-carboxylate reductase [Neisseriaceae bacterium]|nr:pyrroline-5-carboxylate reductase [Neisseriaceae bacterium]